MSTAPGKAGPPDGADSAAFRALYPFLYSGGDDTGLPGADSPQGELLAGVLEDVRRSTIAKIRAIAQLRQTVAEQNGTRLAACARDMAAAFAGGGRLLAFGNGGSATDAQAMATLFLNPGNGPGGDGGPEDGSPGSGGPEDGSPGGDGSPGVTAARKTAARGAAEGDRRGSRGRSRHSGSPVTRRW